MGWSTVEPCRPGVGWGEGGGWVGGQANIQEAKSLRAGGELIPLCIL